MILSGPEDEVVGASIPVPGRGVDPRLLKVGGLNVVRIAGANAPGVDECELRSPPGSTLSKKEPPEVLVVITRLKGGGSVAVVATGAVLTESDEACDDVGVTDIAFIVAMYGVGVGWTKAGVTVAVALGALSALWVLFRSGSAKKASKTPDDAVPFEVDVPAWTHTQRSTRQTLARLPEQLPVVVTHPQISPNRHV